KAPTTTLKTTTKAATTTAKTTTKAATTTSKAATTTSKAATTTSKAATTTTKVSTTTSKAASTTTKATSTTSKASTTTSQKYTGPTALYTGPTTGKRGLAWPWDNTDPVSLFSTPKVSWLYDWSPSPVAAIPSNIEFVPMQWNGVNIQNLDAIVQEYAYEHILGFNEPERTDQSNMNATYAAQLWKQYMNPLSKKYGIKLGAPAITNDPEGIPWIVDFFTACNGSCIVDFVPLHWYGTTLGSLYDFFWTVYGATGNQYPVWITEWAFTNWDTTNPMNATEVEPLMEQAVAYLDSVSIVERYAYFGAMRNTGSVGPASQMIGSNGTLTWLGQQYVNI
ncbi:hypothetical protein SAICODRAFT_141982, partial [Saitoella complicata NRRL Y-17804]|uniref:uncharacterized protein n=1 Tax=Saitoella complicata (strain BCRC 22490 / CBS 7301 / JCM 7358 / NBRC 10748 / NRRL Y-17804) TaxID=698492 RepID=UPI0008668672